MSDHDMSPLRLAGEDVDMDDDDLTMHVSPIERDPAHVAKYLDMVRDGLERSGDYSRPKIRKIMAGFPGSSSPNDPLFQPTWTPSHEVGVAFNTLYPRAMYAFTSPAPPQNKPSPARRAFSRRPTRSQSPPLPSYRHLRRNAIVPNPDPEPTHHISTALSKVPVAAAASRPPAQSTTSSPFMDLPGELKNRIYFYSLVQAENVEVTALNWSTHQPTLLKTCKQIRHEALSIFYNENHISANIDDWSPAVKNRCHELWARYDLKTAQFSHYFTGNPHWENLEAWLKAFFQGKMKGISDVVNKSRALERKTIGVMFLMATVCRAHGVCWPHLQEMLVAQRGLLAKGDGRWLLLN